MTGEHLPQRDAIQLLSRHFVRRFIENDLVSSTADRREGLSLICAGLVSSSVFVTLLLGVKYLGPIATPGRTAVVSLDDKFFFVSYSMAIMAWAAVVIWDALAIDVLDAAILGAMPVPHRVLVLAKLQATVLVAGSLLLVSNLAPLILFPLCQVAALPVGLSVVIAVWFGHVVAVCTAGAFGFFVVVAIRESARALVGATLFKRISAALQAVLVVIVATCFLSIPIAASEVGRSWLARPTVSPSMVPPLWFVGVYEVTGGHVIDNLPREGIAPRVMASESAATALYRQQRPLLRELAGTAARALTVVIVLVVIVYTWNTRTIPILPSTGARAGTVWLYRSAKRVAARIAGPPVQQAGYFFAVQTLMHSDRHRVLIAMSLAVGLAIAMVSLNWCPRPWVIGSDALTIAALAAQPTLLSALLAGARQAMRTPAALSANWIFQLSDQGDASAYVDGVKKAVLTVLAFPVIAISFPPYVALLGLAPAVLHAVCGALFAIIFLDLLCIGISRLPFASAYVPPENLRAWAPVYAIVFGTLIYGLSVLERSSLDDLRLAAILVGTIVVAMVATRAYDRRRRQTAPPIAIDGPSDAGTLRLGLSLSE